MVFIKNNRLTVFRLQKILSISLILFVVILVVISFDYIRAEIRDKKRKADIHQIVTALDLYYDKYEYFPEINNQDWSSRDISLKTQNQEEYFLDILVSEKLIDRVPKDPINNEFYYYRYLKFPAGEYGCKKSFYILQIVNFENKQDEKGAGSCPDINFVEFAENGYTVQKFE